MNILLTGANGLLGSHLINRFDGNHRVTGIGRKIGKSPSNMAGAFVPIDMSSALSLQSFLLKAEFDVIINCAAMTDVDQCEREKGAATGINTTAVDYLIKYCENRGALLLQLSTDYVFNGDNGPYRENDTPTPINHYGKTKLDAETAVLNSKCEYIIARTVHVYGNLPDRPSKQVAWLLNAKDNGRDINCAIDQYSNPTWAGNLADAVIELMNSHFKGIIHIGGDDYISRYEFALEASKLWGIDCKSVKETTLGDLKLLAPRPLRAGLRIEKMKDVLRTKSMGIGEGLSRVLSGDR